MDKKERKSLKKQVRPKDRGSSLASILVETLFSLFSLGLALLVILIRNTYLPTLPIALDGFFDT